MAGQKAAVDFHLHQIESILLCLNEEQNALEEITNKMMDIVFKYKDAEAVVQRALPAHNTANLPHRPEEDPSGDDDQISSYGNETTDQAPVKFAMPWYLEPFAKQGRHEFIVADCCLRLGQGTMSSIQELVVTVEGFAKPFSIPGGYGQSINRYMRAKDSKAAGEESFNEEYVMIHPKTNQYFTRVFSFNPAHKLYHHHRYDITAKINAGIFIMDVEVRRYELLGNVPTVHGRAIDFAVQQGSDIYGFNLSDPIADQSTCSTVKKQIDIVTTALKPGKERKVEISPYLIHPINLDKVYVASSMKTFKHPRKSQRLPGRAGYGSKSCGAGSGKLALLRKHARTKL